MKVQFIVVMGVAGAGKTTIGQMLAQELKCPFADGDDFHSRQNKDKMSAGVALSDDDRRPWLQSMRLFAQECLLKGSSLVLACSALKAAYREQLQLPSTTFVFLDASPDLTQKRLSERKEHYMKANMLDSQFATLEKPPVEEALIIDASRPAAEILATILGTLLA